jgi:hypothetical protein
MKLSTLIALVLAILLALLLSLLLPGQAFAYGQKSDPNVNSRYDVEAVSISGVPDSRISRALRDDMQRMVGSKYDQDTAKALVGRMRDELTEYRVVVKVRRGQEADHVRVDFEAYRRAWNADLFLPQLVYHSYEGFSGAISFGVAAHHNAFFAGVVSSSDELLERNAGYTLRYEHRRVGTDAVQVKLEFGRYHQTFTDETLGAAAASSDVPDIYRTRKVFAPGVSVIPLPGLTLSAGLSFQGLGVALPTVHTVTAYAVTADALFRRRFHGDNGMVHSIAAEYGLRAGTRALESDLAYTRHLASANYTLSLGRQVFGAHARVGHIDGPAPFFERFSLGNAALLRGWDKFDVAPLGGSRLAYGSLEYRYRPFRIFYDVGAVWDPAGSPTTRHALGVGLVSKDGIFLSVGFPVRLHQVKPAVMFGFRRELP